MLFEPQGREIWKYRADDIIADIEFLPGALHLTLWDDLRVQVDWATDQRLSGQF